ncbi:hypothetical protein OTU49_002711, partial [Cherax quadricarinatus]
TQLKIPQVSYIKALDIWMGVCTAFIFAALLEFTVVNYYWRKKLSSPCHNPCRPKTTSDSWMELMPNGRGGEQTPQASPAADVAEFSISRADTRRYRLLACRIDEVSRYLFPVTFLVFNVAYWCYYMSHRH